MRLLILTSILASVSGYGYRYSRHPQTGECYLQLNLPDGKQNAYAGTNSRYGGNDGKYHHYGNEGKYGTSNSKYDGSASIQHSSLVGGGGNGGYKGSSSSSGSYGSSGGSYGPSGGGYGGTNKYESNSSNNRYNSPSSGYGGSSSSSSSGGYGGNRNSYSSPSSSEYNSDSGNRNVGSGTKYSSSSYGASDKSPSYSSKGSSSSYSGGGNRFSSSKSPSYSSTYPAASSSSSYSSSSSLSRPSYSTRPIDYKEEEYSSKKHLSSSSETMKQTTIVEGNGGGGGSSYGTRNPSYSSSYESNRNSQAPQFEDCGVYEYYSKKYRKCVRFGSREDEEEQLEKKGSSYGGTGGSRYSGDGGSRESGYYAGSSSGGSSYGGNRPSSSYGGSGGSSYGSSSSSRYTPSSNGGSYSSSSSGNSGYGSAGKYGNDDGAYLKKDFAREVLSAHNSYRAKHFTPPVTLDEEMSLKAQAWAVDLASGRVQFGHSPSAVEGKFGESLEIVNDSSVDGSSIVEDWYREKRNYNFDKPVLVKKPKSSANSHFTAILWKGTRKIGVGKATANDGRTFVVVNYFPAGNIVDILEDNVSRGRTDLQSSREQFF